jgi:hypothetical protein
MTTLSARTYMMTMARATLVCSATEFQTLIYMDITTIVMFLITTHTIPRIIRRMHHPCLPLCQCLRSAQTDDTKRSLSKIYDTRQRMSLMACPVGMAQRMHSAVVRIPICVGKPDTMAVGQDLGMGV